MHKPLLVIALSLAPVSTAEVSLEGANWIATELLGKPIASRPAPNFQLHPVDKQITGFSGCNRIFGPYKSSSEVLQLGPVAATRVACAGISAEPQFLEAIAATSTYRITGNELQLQDKAGRVIGRFLAGTN